MRKQTKHQSQVKSSRIRGFENFPLFEKWLKKKEMKVLFVIFMICYQVSTKGIMRIFFIWCSSFILISISMTIKFICGKRLHWNSHYANVQNICLKTSKSSKKISYFDVGFSVVLITTFSFLDFLILWVKSVFLCF
jgi:hypothetical protein